MRFADELDAVFDVREDFLDTDLRSEAVVCRDEGVFSLADTIVHVLWDIPTRALDRTAISMKVEEDRLTSRVLAPVDVELEFEGSDGFEDDGLVGDGHVDGG